MITGCRVRKMRCRPARTSLPSSANSGPRWSMVGKSMARRTRSGTLVGPGICRKWRPARLGMSYSTCALMNLTRLQKEVDGEVLFDAASRGRYATDASIYQVMPLGVVVPRSEEAARAAIAIAAEEGVPILPRGAGSSQCGQAVGE